MASAASAAKFTSSLLPNRLRDVVDSGVATAMSAWIMMASYLSTSSTAVIYCYTRGFYLYTKRAHLAPSENQREEKVNSSIKRTVNSLVLIKLFHILSDFASATLYNRVGYIPHRAGRLNFLI
jgi:hypothetical protein